MAGSLSFDKIMVIDENFVIWLNHWSVNERNPIEELVDFNNVHRLKWPMDE